MHLPWQVGKEGVAALTTVLKVMAVILQPAVLARRRRILGLRLCSSPPAAQLLTKQGTIC